MSSTLEPAAAEAAAALRALDRALAEAREPWNDPVRQSFDQRYAEPLLGEARKISSNLSDLSHTLVSAMRELEEVQS